jgi:hypothetical protein
LVSIRSWACEHRVGQIHADDRAGGTDHLLDQWEVQTGAACDVDHGVTRAKAECPYGLAALCPLGVARHGVQPGGDVVVLRLLAICLEQMLSRTVDLAHGVLLDLDSVTMEPPGSIQDYEPPGLGDSTAALMPTISRSLTR